MRSAVAVSSLRRRVLADPATTLKSSRRRRHPELPWLYVVDVLSCSIGHRVAVVRAKWWRGDLVELDVLAGDPAAVLPALRERMAERKEIARVVAMARTRVPAEVAYGG